MPLAATAGPLTYFGTLTSPSLSRRFNGGINATQILLVGAETGIQITVDSVALTLNYDLIQYQTQAYSYTFTENVSAGFGVSNLYTIGLNFDPITIEYTSAPNNLNALNPGSNGLYTVVGNAPSGG